MLTTTQRDVLWELVVFDNSKASCLGVNPELFFLETFDPIMFNALKKLCNGCELLKECTEYSLQHNVDGFWAGMPKSTRRKKQRELGITPITLFQENKQDDRSA